MNYWITIHWPQFIDEKHTRIPEIEVKEHPDNIGYISSLKKGDLIFVYGTKTSQPSKIDGKTYHRPKAETNGIKSIYTVASDGWLERKELGIRYGMWYATMEKTKYRGHVSQAKANEILGYKKNNPFRHIGPDGCGLKMITKDQADKFMKYFRQPGNKPT
jgi:hypothetical protein